MFAVHCHGVCVACLFVWCVCLCVLLRCLMCLIVFVCNCDVCLLCVRCRLLCVCV